MKEWFKQLQAKLESEGYEDLVDGPWEDLGDVERQSYRGMFEANLSPDQAAELIKSDLPEED